MSVTFGVICMLAPVSKMCVCVCACACARVLFSLSLSLSLSLSPATGAIYIGLWILQTLGNVGILGQSAQDYVLEINTLIYIALKENLL
jgi:hypothetical protein